MAITDLPALSALRTRMQWHQERQRVLAENISNADTPGYMAKDLREPKLDGRGIASGGFGASLAMMQTSSGHVAASGGASFARDNKVGYETRPTGNNVNLEDEMLKVSANQMDYAAATSLYSRSLALLKTAIGKR